MSMAYRVRSSSRFLVTVFKNTENLNFTSFELKLPSASKLKLYSKPLNLDYPRQPCSCRRYTTTTHVPGILRNYGTKHDTQSVVRAPGDVLFGVDEIQAKLMQEECIIVDRNDKNIGSASKKECHLLDNIRRGMLHRAFSVFLFNTKGELLIQQRAAEKITFPDHFTNTCCSHPLSFPDEVDETDAIGVKRAAQRKLKHELGIEPEQAYHDGTITTQCKLSIRVFKDTRDLHGRAHILSKYTINILLFVPLQDFHYLTRIMYKAENIPKDNKWGEYEIDYILFIKRDVDVKASPNEVKSYRYVTQSELKEIVDTADSKGILLTPWFKLIAHNFLYQWWSNLDRIQSQVDRDTIHRFV